MSKALFRAQRKKPNFTGQDPLFVDLPKDNVPLRSTRIPKDYYPTGEPEAILSLLSYDGARIRQSGTVWEPACGKGDMVRHIRAAGIPCCASDLIDRGCPDSWTADYYSCLRSRGGAIITNPPFNEINAKNGHGRWLRHTLNMEGWDYLALLLSWDWPAARINGLGELLDHTPPTYTYLMRWRLDFTGEGNPPNRHAWFIWDRKDPRSRPGMGPYAEPSFRWMDRVDPRQETML
ncbi:hypothetical protein JQX09_17885 [Sulfitobacter pseudonitzschiae]|uniref:Methyltransferase n=1 Tax=Pseudosulfitobacter pseudonitzschiae TaxID=1402135 RepID=A0A9Q2NPA3_9RHOB|nr:hypothetical protein [Pseudosulfitobacter pseudonitzschiae]MBM2293802.1 hypothetical protein [Pseudosulfitobacter pseudonitzschiae]MBM2298719.1 hypothetical protein [Pseudosulfitobacter pseudonitzschiae]MBM2303634.1 hypothetical protein [Pseudosulfitobacter pseudonitzschiae]MBM2313416.1 hypothetical protein [Pseudosulfitobacter pseudonitzschiae]MBM2318330.1 hypothetical protein [Pseudosulfitobacter pseudonitzschiae]